MVDKKLIVEKLDKVIKCLEDKVEFAAEDLIKVSDEHDIKSACEKLGWTKLRSDSFKNELGYVITTNWALKAPDSDFVVYTLKCSKLDKDELDPEWPYFGEMKNGSYIDPDDSPARGPKKPVSYTVTKKGVTRNFVKTFSAEDDTYILYSYTIDPNNKVEYPRTIVHAGLEDTCHKLKEQKEKNPERSDFKYKVVKLSTFIKKFGDRGWQKYKFYKGILNKNFSTPVEDRSYRDALDAIEKAKNSSIATWVEHAPDKYKDYISSKSVKGAKEKGYLDIYKNGKQIPVPFHNTYVGSIFNKSCYLTRNVDPTGERELDKCILKIGGTYDELKEDTRGLKDKYLTHQERDLINKRNKAINDLKRYQNTMTVNSREEFTRLAKEIADKLHEYNKQGL